MGDATKKRNDNRILQAFQLSGKRARENKDDDRRQKQRLTGEYSGNTSGEITPTASNGDLNNNIDPVTTDTENEVSDIESQHILPSIRINDREASKDTVVDAASRNDSKLKLAFRIDNLRNKTERYDSHATFLKKCLENNIIPNGLKCYVEPSIGNKDDTFLNEWHTILDETSIKLMNLTIAYSEKTSKSTTEQTTKLSGELKEMVSESAYKNITTSLNKNEEARTKDLVQRKNRKFYRLKYGEKEREQPSQPYANNREKEIWNNRGQRGQGSIRNNEPEKERVQSRWNSERRDDGNHNPRYVNNNHNNSSGSDRGQDEDRILNVIHQRNQRDAPIHEQILGRRPSRRNMNDNNRKRNNLGEDFPPLRGGPRDDNRNRETNQEDTWYTRPRENNRYNANSRESDREENTRYRSRDSPREDNRVNDNYNSGNSRESDTATRDREIAKLREQVNDLQRERRGEANQTTSTDTQSKNGERAHGPDNENPLNQDDMRTFIQNAMATMQDFVTRLDRQTNSEMTHSDK